MSGRRSISNSFNVVTVDDPVSVVAQYAPNANPSSSQIHDTWQNGDLYMRTKSTEDGATWSAWHKMVGENGDETDYTFNISKSKTSSSSTTAPSDCYYQTWQDAPVAPTSTYPYMWMKIVKKTWNESTQSYDSGTPSYARMTGEKGADAPYVELSRSTILYKANSDGYSIESQNFAITYSLKVKGNACTIASVNNISISLPANVTVVSGTKTTSGCTINCNHSKIMSGVITITITGTYDGVTYTATGTITVDSSREGEKGDPGDPGSTGQRGKAGRFYYYAGDYSDFSSSDTFSITDAQAPYFKYYNNYWVFNPEENGTYTKSQMGTPSSSSSNWQIMTSDFKYIITQAIFSAFAQFGSSIMNGDYMMSQYVLAKGFQNTIEYINNGTKFQYIDTNDVMGEDTFYDWEEHPSYFPLNWSAASASAYIGVDSTSYTSSAKSGIFSLGSDSEHWNGLMYTVEIEYHSDVDIDWKLATLSSTSNPPASGMIPKAFVEEGVFFTKAFFITLDSPSLSKYLYFKLHSSGYTYGATIRSIKVRRVKFVPIMCIDMLRGKLEINNIVARGELHADGFYYSAIHSNSNDDILVVTNESIVTLGKKSVGTTVIIPEPSAANVGHVIEIHSGQNVKDQSGNRASWYLSYRGLPSGEGFYTPYEAGDGDGYGKRGTAVYWSGGGVWSTYYRVSMGSVTYIKVMCQKHGDKYIWVILKAEQTLVANLTLKGGTSSQPISIICNPYVGDIS